jgi:chorismate mutase
MHEVARWKWHHHQPITDAAREAALLEQTGDRAHDLGLDADLSVRFVKAQITAGKLMQQQDMDSWQTQPPPQDEPLRNLATELRPKIDQLNVDLLEALAGVAPHLNDEQVQRRLQDPATEAWSGAGFSDEIRATALEPLLTGRNR